MSIVNKALSSINDVLNQGCDVNVGSSERVLSVVSGGFILGVGVKNLFKSPLTSFSGILLGGALIYRGVTGRCKVKEIVQNNDTPEATVIEHRYFVK